MKGHLAAAVVMALGPALNGWGSCVRPGVPGTRGFRAQVWRGRVGERSVDAEGSTTLVRVRGNLA
jgi:hypothetical protein